ncbi:MAG TPA: hypothetical protein VIM75_00315 [Ohtaekwangia sp.]|uniref:hypothetical protein n=1 Tax=Ohtaekwangia sp. TaxID=2066019 RepID=UPI002F9578C1
MKSYSAFILLLLIFAGCIQKSVTEPPRKIVNLDIGNNDSIVAIDSLMYREADLPIGNIFPCGEYRVVYLGDPHDTILFEEKGIIPYKTKENDHRNIQDWTEADSTKMTIRVDTTLNLLSYATYRKEIGGKEVEDSTAVKYVRCNIMVVRNHSDSTLYMGINNDIGRMVMQYQASDGKWITGQLPIYYGCGTGARELFLRKEQIAVAKFLRGNGNIKVLARIKFETLNGHYIYSNTFYNYINFVPKKDFTNNDLQMWYDKYGNEVLFIARY